MDGIIEFKSSLEGRSYKCVYKRTYSECLGCYAFTMVPGSLNWESLAPREDVHAESWEVKNEPLLQSSSAVVRGTR
jgi:hypothetical protein